jgi:hypothetical protein
MQLSKHPHLYFILQLPGAYEVGITVIPRVEFQGRYSQIEGLVLRAYKFGHSRESRAGVERCLDHFACEIPKFLVAVYYNFIFVAPMLKHFQVFIHNHHKGRRGITLS